jgi:hypothetical protein
MTLVKVPFEQSCCEHQLVAGSQSNEQNVPLATPDFAKAQAPGGSDTFPFAAAAEMLSATTAPANNATFTNDIARILVPCPKICLPAPVTR